MKLTKIESKVPDRVSKVITNEDGKLKKESVAFIMGGDAKIEDVDFYNLDVYLNGLAQNEIVCLGTPPSDGEIKTKKAVRISKEGFSRSKDFFKFGKGYLLFDIDDISAGETIDTMLQKFYSLDPKLEKSRHLVRFSSSSWIYDNNDVEMAGLRGLHIFYPVEDYTNLEAYVTYLKDKAWELDLGMFRISSAGHKLERFSVFDASVFSPERLIFETKPLTINCEQKCPPSKVVAGSDVGDFLVLEPQKMTRIQKALSEKNYNRSKLSITKEADIIREKFYEELWGTRYKDVKVSRKRTIEALIDDVWLPADFVIETSKGLMEVGMLWMDQSLDDITCEDPFRGQAVGTAKFSYDKYRPYVFSFRGMVKYFIEKPPRSWMIRHGFEVEAIEDLIDVELLEELNMSNYNKNLEFVADELNKAMSSFVRYKKDYFRLSSPKEMSANAVSASVLSIIKSRFDWTVSKTIEKKNGGLTIVQLDKDQITALKDIIVSGISNVDEIIYRSTYDTLVDFKSERNNNTLEFIYKAAVPIRPTQQKPLNYDEIRNWYLLDKFNETPSLINNTIAELFGVTTKWDKSYIKYMNRVSNFGKTEYQDKPFREIGIGVGVSAREILQLTGGGRMISGLNPMKLLMPIVSVDEVADLDHEEMDMFLESIKNFTSGMACRGFSSASQTIIGHQLLLSSKKKIPQLENAHSEYVNRLVVLESNKNEPYNEIWDPSEVRLAAKWIIYDYWMYYMTQYEMLDGQGRRDLADQIVYGYDPKVLLMNASAEPWKYLVSALGEINEDILIAPLGHHFYAEDDRNLCDTMMYRPAQKTGPGVSQHTPAYIYIKSRKKFNGLMFANSGLSRGAVDDVYSLIEQLFEIPSSKHFAFRVPSVKITQQGPANIMLTKTAIWRLEHPGFDPTEYSRLCLMLPEDIYEELICDPSKFKNNWPVYVKRLAD